MLKKLGPFQILSAIGLMGGISWMIWVQVDFEESHEEMLVVQSRAAEQDPEDEVSQAARARDEKAIDDWYAEEPSDGPEDSDWGAGAD